MIKKGENREMKANDWHDDGHCEQQWSKILGPLQAKSRETALLRHIKPLRARPFYVLRWAIYNFIMMLRISSNCAFLHYFTAFILISTSATRRISRRQAPLRYIKNSANEIPVFSCHVHHVEWLKIDAQPGEDMIKNYNKKNVHWLKMF